MMWLSKGVGKIFSSRFWIKIKTNDPLTVMLLVLQGISLSTTVQGAKIIFPETQTFPIPGVKIPIYIALGLTIQFLIIILLIFGAARRAPIRRAIAVITLTFFSTYTSFFSIYNGIRGGELDERLFNADALERHRSLKSLIYTPYRSQLDQYLERKALLEQRKKRKLRATESQVFQHVVLNV